MTNNAGALRAIQISIPNLTKQNKVEAGTHQKRQVKYTTVFFSMLRRLVVFKHILRPIKDLKILGQVSYMLILYISEQYLHDLYRRHATPMCLHRGPMTLLESYATFMRPHGGCINPQLFQKLIFITYAGPMHLYRCPQAWQSINIQCQGFGKSLGRHSNLHTSIFKYH